MSRLSSPVMGLLLLCNCAGNEFSASGGGGGSSSLPPDASPGAAGAGGSGSGSGGTSPGGTGGSTPGGAGGTNVSDAGLGGADAAPACPDDDGDGQTTCAGDCDDDDAENFTGNSEICGDLADNDCNQQSDEICNALGTFVSAVIGDDNNPGTKADPVKTIAAGIGHAKTIGNGVDVYVAEGQYPEKVTVEEGISLFGGYSCTARPCSWARDPATAISEIDNTDFQGVVIGHAVTRATFLEGFTIKGLSGDLTGAAVPGTVAVAVLGGAASITRNVIEGGAATGGIWNNGRSVGIAVLSDASAATDGPFVDGNDIEGGASTNQSIGILFDAGGSGTVTYGEVARNTVRGGNGATSAGIVAWTSDASVLIEENAIAGGASTGAGGSWGVIVGGALTLDGNTINVTSTPSCTTVTSWCGGILSESSTTVITNNVIRGADALWSSGVTLAEFEKPAGAVVLNSNDIDGAGKTANLSLSAAVRIVIGSCTTCGFNGRVGSMRNNILLGGASGSRWGVYEDPSSNGQTQHPVALENNQFYVPSIAAADGLYRYHDGANPTRIIDISDVNNLANLISGLPVSANQEGDPMTDATFHLLTGSPCIDKATSTEAPSADRDGDPRPDGSAGDIGPDEAG
jgi:hypothetical protein